MTATVSDGVLDVSQTFTWTVTGLDPGARPCTNPGDRTNAEGATIALPLVATDPDGNALTYDATGLPPGLTIDPTTGLIAGTLGFSSEGTYPLTVTVSDGTLATSQTFTWTVTHTNRPPVLANPGDQVNEDSAGYAQGVVFDVPVQYLRLGEPGGAAAEDWSGYGRTGTYHGPVAYGQPGAIADGTTAVAFDGTDGAYVDAGLAGHPFGTGSLSMETWFQTSAADDVLRFIADNKGGWSNDAGFNLAVFNGLLYWRVADGTTQFFQWSQRSNLNDGQWHHVVCVLDRLFDGTHDRLLLYVDGNPGPRQQSPGGRLERHLTHSVELGRLQGAGGSGFIGALGEWAIYGYALSPAQIATHYARRAVNEPPMSLQLVASDPDGDSLVYSATGLPPALTVNPATGLISGALDFTSAGTHLVTATASDGSLQTSQAFTWTVAGSFADPDGMANANTSAYALAVLADAPVAYWRLGETGGTQALDSAGTNHGTLSGGITLGQPGALADGSTAMRFDGVDGTAVSVPGSPALDVIDQSSAITMEASISPQAQITARTAPDLLQLPRQSVQLSRRLQRRGDHRERSPP